MKFSAFALSAAVLASVANGFAGPQVTPRFALQVRLLIARTAFGIHDERWPSTLQASALRSGVTIRSVSYSRGSGTFVDIFRPRNSLGGSLFSLVRISVLSFDDEGTMSNL